MKRFFTIGGVLLLIVPALGAFPANAVNTENRFLRGDADGDGSVSIGDVTAIQRHLGQLALLDSACLAAADIDGNGLSIADATAIQRYLAEYDDTCAINEWVTAPGTQSTSVWITPGENELPYIH